MHLAVRPFAIILFGALLALSLVFQAQGKSKDPIRIGLSGQTSQKIMAHIVGRVLTKAGFKFEFVEFTGPQIDMLASGAAHLSTGFVVADEADAFRKAVADKRIISLGGLKKNQQDEAVLKVIWAGVHSKWPYAERMLKTMIVSPQDLEAIAQTVDAGRSTVDQAVDGWMKDNRSKWKRWLSASTNWMKP